MGSLWGSTAATRSDSTTIYADIELGADGAVPIDSDADERALMLVGGEAEIEGQKLEEFALYVLKPGYTPLPSSLAGGRLMPLGGQAVRTPRHVFRNFVSSPRDRINQAK